MVPDIADGSDRSNVLHNVQISRQRIIVTRGRRFPFLQMHTCMAAMYRLRSPSYRISSYHA